MSTTSFAKVKSSLVALILPLLFLTIAAQPASAQRQITFNEAIQIALEQNNQIKVARNQIDLQSLQVQSARAQFVPSLSASAGTGRSWGISQDPTTFEVRNTVSESASFSASSGITLFNGLQNVQNVRSAQASREGTEYALERTQQDVIFSVINGYMNYMLTEERIRIQEENVEAARRQLAQIQEFVNVGQRARSDLYSQEATLASAESQLLQAELNFENAKTNLIRALQLDPLTEYDFVAPDVSEMPLTLRQYNAEQMLRTALEQRPDLHSSELQIESAHYGLKSARGRRLPTISMSGRISSGWSSQSSLSFQDQLRNGRGESVSFSLNIPLFSRFNTRNAIESSQVQYENAVYGLETAQLTVAADVRQAYITYQINTKNLDVTEKQLRSAEQALEVEQSRYDLGSSTLVELTQARAQYVNAQSQRAQAIIQFHFQQRIIEYYQGTMDPNQPLFTN